MGHGRKTKVGEVAIDYELRFYPRGPHETPGSYLRKLVEERDMAGGDWNDVAEAFVAALTVHIEPVYAQSTEEVAVAMDVPHLPPKSEFH